MRRTLRKISWLALFLFFLLSATSVLAVSVERMPKEQLKSRIVAGDVVVVDVRTDRDWRSNRFKIKGAVRPEKDIVKWASQYSKDTTLVLYCA